MPESTPSESDNDALQMQFARDHLDIAIARLDTANKIHETLSDAIDRSQAAITETAAATDQQQAHDAATWARLAIDRGAAIDTVHTDFTGRFQPIADADTALQARYDQLAAEHPEGVPVEAMHDLAAREHEQAAQARMVTDAELAMLDEAAHPKLQELVMRKPDEDAPAERHYHKVDGTMVKVGPSPDADEMAAAAARPGTIVEAVPASDPIEVHRIDEAAADGNHGDLHADHSADAAGWSAHGSDATVDHVATDGSTHTE